MPCKAAVHYPASAAGLARPLQRAAGSRWVHHRSPRYSVLSAHAGIQDTMVGCSDAHGVGRFQKYVVRSPVSPQLWESVYTRNGANACHKDPLKVGFWQLV